MLVIVFLALKQAYLRVLQRVSRTRQTGHLNLVPFLLIFSTIMLSALHGTSILKIAVILSLNYAIAKACGGSKLGPLLGWVFNGAVLFANEWSEGYRFASIHPSLQSWVWDCCLRFAQYSSPISNQDYWEGIYPRWHIIFNITMLRLISFNMDYYWACNETRPTEVSI